MSLLLRTWRTPERGALFVVTGASGTGKTTLVKEALRVIPGLGFSVSATTRAPRRGEQDGVDYHFLDQAQFDELRARDGLLEWAQVYGNHYGTPREPVERDLRQGRSVLLEIDLQGARAVRQALPSATLIYVLPPSMAALESRLRARSTDSEEVIQRRLADARSQLSGCGDFDFLVINDDLQSAHDQFQAVLVATLLQRSRHEALVQTFTS